MRILVCIASYGLRNDQYLHQLIEQYATMPHAVHVVVVSNIRKELPKGVELKVGLPIRNPGRAVRRVRHLPIRNRCWISSGTQTSSW